VAQNSTQYNRQLHPDEIEFASDDGRVKRFAADNGLTLDQARQELLRTAAAMVDRGWNTVLTESDGKTARAAGYLRIELAQAKNDHLFQVSLADYNNERDGLVELFKDKNALNKVLKNVALIDPLSYRTDARYMREVLNAKGEGSQEGFGIALDGAVSGASKTALWAMGAANCPSCAASDIEAAWNSILSIPEELRLKGYLDNLHIMQGGGAAIIRANEASSAAAGVGLGLAIDGGLGGVLGGAKEVTPSAAEGSFGSQSKNNSSRSWKYENRVDVTQRPAAAVNADHAAIGNNPPYKLGTVVVEYTTKEADVFVRVHNVNNPNRPWMMRKEAIAGLSAEQIQFKYSLPSKPSYVSEVHVPAGTRIRM
jgi:filamentous hemagglutinin